MDIPELAGLLKKEKQRLLKATEYIVSFYKQIYNSLVNLRDTLFNHAFPGNQDWKKQLLSATKTFIFPEFGLISNDGRIQNNADFLISTLNNIQVLQSVYMPELETLTVDGVEKINAVNLYIRSFIQRLYIKENLSILSGQRLEVANSIRHNIEDRLDNNIEPFFHYLELIVKDEFRIALRSNLKQIVGNYKNYMVDPFGYDKQLKQKCQELKLEYHQDLILGIIADLSKEQNVYIEEILSKYKNEESTDQKKNVFRLKEIAQRFLSQTTNIARLESFIEAVQVVFQPVSFFNRMMDFFWKLITGKGPEGHKKDFTFMYSSRQGKLELKHSTLLGLLKELELFKAFLIKFRGNVDFLAYTKSSSQVAVDKLDNVIDNCITELTKIYEQCNGLREWLVNPKHQKMLKKLPSNRQEEFNDVLLAINYILIINKQYLRDMDRLVK